MVTSPTRQTPLTEIEILRQNRLWFLALGVIQIVFGMIAIGHSVMATLVSMVLLGWLLVIGGALSIGHAYWQRHWNGFFIDLLTGVLYAVVGFIFLDSPAEAAISLTLLFALFLFVGGIFRMIVSFLGPFHHRWLLLNGLITFLLGLMIWKQWPLSGLWVIGLFIGIEMIFYGWSLVMLGVAAGKLTDVSGKQL
jgi:uncharacterized membrane protein HdeD (DUF308 family)